MKAYREPGASRTRPEDCLREIANSVRRTAALLSFRYQPADEYDVVVAVYEDWLAYDDRQTGAGFGLRLAVRKTIEDYRRKGSGQGGQKLRHQAIGWAFGVLPEEKAQRHEDEAFIRSMRLGEAALERAIRAWDVPDSHREAVAAYYTTGSVVKAGAAVGCSRTTVNNRVRAFEYYIHEAMGAEYEHRAKDSQRTVFGRKGGSCANDISFSAEKVGAAQ